MSLVFDGDSSVSVSTVSGNPRILGDFSNATVASRAMFQSSTTNGNTEVSIIPNGTGNAGIITAFNNSNPTNAASLRAFAGASDVRIASAVTGTGTYLPLTFYTGGSERMRIDTDGIITATRGNVLLVSETAKTASTSNVDFSNIPSWVKRITVMFNGVSTSGTQNFGIRVGTSGGFVTSGYNGTVFNSTGATSNLYSTNNFAQVTINNAAANLWSGSVVLTLLGSNVWTITSILGMSNTNGAAHSAGSIDATGTLTQLRIMTVSTDTFDAGSINIIYE